MRRVGYINNDNNVVVLNDESSLEEFLNNTDLSGISIEILGHGSKFTFISKEPPAEIISPEAQAVLDRMTGLTAQERSAIITFVNAESTTLGNGNWSFVDEFFCFSLVSGNVSNALQGWKTKTATNNGAVLSIDGATFSGAESIDSNWNPTNDAVNFELSNCFGEVFIREITSGGNYFGSGDDLFRASEVLGTQWRAKGNSGTLIFFNTRYENPVNTLYGLRIDTNAVNYINGNENQVIPNAPSTIPNANISIGTAGLNGVITTFMVGSFQGVDYAAHYSNLIAFLNALGVNLTP